MSACSLCGEFFMERIKDVACALGGTLFIDKVSAIKDKPDSS
jgi:hypothetical protein